MHVNGKFMVVIQNFWLVLMEIALFYQLRLLELTVLVFLSECAQKLQALSSFLNKNDLVVVFLRVRSLNIVIVVVGLLYDC